MENYQIIGNIGNDPETRDVNGINAISFSVAVDKSYKNAQGEKVEKTKWVRCTIWRKPEASGVAQYLKKGMKVFVCGDIEAKGYTTKDGEVKADLNLRVNQIEFMSKATSDQPAQRATYSDEELTDDLPF